MSLLRRVIRPLYHPGRAFITLIFLGLFWIVNNRNINQSSAEFFKSLKQKTLKSAQSEISSLQQDTLKSAQSENSSLQQETLKSAQSEISSLQQETLKSAQSENSSLQQDTLKSAQSENSSLFRLEPPVSLLLFEDNLQKSEVVAGKGTIGNPQNKGKKKENAVARRLRTRREKVLEVCRREKIQQCYLSNVLNFRIYFFHRYDTSVCTIAKSASSTWRAHLRRVNKGPPFNVPIDNDKIRKAFLQRPIEVISKDVNSFSKIITVRHPLSRLVAAFRHKYRNGALMQQHKPVFESKVRKRIAGSQWHERFHQFWLPALFANNMVPPNTHLKVGIKKPIDPSVLYSIKEYERLYRFLKPQITFVQFLKYVLKTYDEGKPDAHWKPYHDNCCPCHFDYDYITKVETLSEDLEYVFKKLGIPANPDTSMNQKRKSVDELYSDFAYYRKVPTTLRRRIYQYLKYDMDLFGYELPKNFLI
ncbi:carbohydrate sulfotransferase 10-like [Palaemon carinicauda]|uniref:carbohydrate sulfotransferase 10-like n=1 Tax=Palaemon carinicauda TaxID=392227 RepID=UPI0035B69DF8